jgi:hypothetical protein
MNHQEYIPQLAIKFKRWFYADIVSTNAMLSKYFIGRSDFFLENQKILIHFPLVHRLI